MIKLRFGYGTRHDIYIIKHEDGLAKKIAELDKLINIDASLMNKGRTGKDKKVIENTKKILNAYRSLHGKIEIHLTVLQRPLFLKLTESPEAGEILEAGNLRSFIDTLFAFTKNLHEDFGKLEAAWIGIKSNYDSSNMVSERAKRLEADHFLRSINRLLPPMEIKNSPLRELAEYVLGFNFIYIAPKDTDPVMRRDSIESLTKVIEDAGSAIINLIEMDKELKKELNIKEGGNEESDT